MILKRLLKSRRGAEKPGKHIGPKSANQSGGAAPAPSSAHPPADLKALLAASPETREGDQLRELLSIGGSGITLEERLGVITADRDPTLLAHLARSAREADVRLAALRHASGERLFEEVALHDRDARVRQLAVSRLETGDALSRVMESARGHDARTAREARRRLEAIHESERLAEARGREIEALCREADEVSTGADAASHLDARLDRLENRWSSLAAAATIEQRDRFAAAIAHGRQAAAEREQAANAGLADTLHALRQLSADALGARLREVEDALHRYEHLADGDVRLRDVAADAAFLRLWREGLRAWHGHQGTIEALLAELRQYPGDAERRRQLGQLVDDVDWPDGLAPPPVLRQARELLAKDHEARPASAAEKPGTQDEATLLAQHRQAFETQRGQVVTALDQGDVRRARRLLGRMHKRVEQLPGRLRHAFEEPLKPLSARLQELQDWRRFAVLPKQETLCRRMEELAETPLPPQEQLDGIQALREEWKALGGSDSRESRALWERFQQAAERAFEPCRAWFQALHAQKDANLQERLRICDQLEEFLATKPPEELDLQALEEIHRTAREAWRLASPVDPHRGRGAKRRFRRAMDTINGELMRRRGGVREEKKQLLDAARHLSGHSDLREAVQEAKRLQKAWRELPPLPPGEERRRHRELQQACDQVFERVRGASQEQERRAAEVQATVEGLCADVRLLIDRRADEAALKEGLRMLREAHGQAADRVRRQLNRDVEQVTREVREALASMERQRWLDELDRLRAVAEAVRLAEAAAQGKAELPAYKPDTRVLSAGLAETLRERWDRACGMAGEVGFPADELAGVAERRRRLCVHAEIIAGIESPAEDRDLRMTLQVERLSASLAAGEHDEGRAAMDQLARDWYLLGPWPVDGAEHWEMRFRAALERAA